MEEIAKLIGKLQPFLPCRRISTRQLLQSVWKKYLITACPF